MSGYYFQVDAAFLRRSDSGCFAEPFPNNSSLSSHIDILAEPGLDLPPSITIRLGLKCYYRPDKPTHWRF